MDVSDSALTGGAAATSAVGRSPASLIAPISPGAPAGLAAAIFSSATAGSALGDIPTDTEIGDGDDLSAGGGDSGSGVSLGDHSEPVESDSSGDVSAGHIADRAAGVGPPTLESVVSEAAEAASGSAGRPVHVEAHYHTHQNIHHHHNNQNIHVDVHKHRLRHYHYHYHFHLNIIHHFAGAPPSAHPAGALTLPPCQRFERCFEAADSAGTGSPSCPIDVDMLPDSDSSDSSGPELRLLACQSFERSFLAADSAGTGTGSLSFPIDVDRLPAPDS